MAVNLTTLYTRLGKAFFAGDTAVTETGTSIPDEAEDYVQQLSAGSLDIIDTASNVAGAVRSIRSAGGSFVNSSVKTPSQKLLVQTIKDDVQLPDNTTLTATKELIAQMDSSSDSVNASAVGGSTAYNANNTGDGVLVYSTLRGDGKANEHILGEALVGTATSSLSSGQASFTVAGEPSVALTNVEWPGGSGTSVPITSYVGSSGSNLVSGAFETEDTNVASLPNGWIEDVATLGTTVKLTDVEVQTVIISGTPTSGTQVWRFTDKDGLVQSTTALVYSATNSAVLSALRALTGLSSVAVATSGTSPNFTHTITFTGVPNPGQLTSTETFDVGSIAHATTTAGSANFVRGARSMEWDSDGAELTTLYHLVPLVAATSYTFNTFIKADVVPAAGAIKVELLDGIGGSVIADDESTSNLLDIDITAITTSFVATSATFRTPSVMPDTVYLRLRISTAITVGSSVFIDEMCLVPSSQLYVGGPNVALFTGATPWELNDELTITATNDRGGAIHEWCNRVYDLRTNNLLLPSNSAGGETISDSLIS